MQPLLSSSYHGYGVSSLDADAEELHLLVKHLKDKFSSKVWCPLNYIGLNLSELAFLAFGMLKVILFMVPDLHRHKEFCRMLIACFMGLF